MDAFRWMADRINSGRPSSGTRPFTAAICYAAVTTALRFRKFQRADGNCAASHFVLPSEAVATAKNNPNLNPNRERLVSAAPVEDDSSFELKLRPQRLAEFIGQRKVKENLAVVQGYAC